jgi:hypothetical protein
VRAYWSSKLVLPIHELQFLVQDVKTRLPKVVIVAVMRKMITMLNAMVRDDLVWADRLSGRHVLPTAR